MLYMPGYRKFCFTWYRGAWNIKIYHIWYNWSNDFWRLSEGWVRVAWGLRVEWFFEGWLRVEWGLAEGCMKINFAEQKKTVTNWCCTWRDAENIALNDPGGPEAQKSTVFEKIDQMCFGGCLRVAWGLSEGWLRVGSWDKIDVAQKCETVTYWCCTW